MKTAIFKAGISIVGLAFTVIFCMVVMPPLIKNPDVIEALKAGFVNPYASGYSADVICCWLILLIWVVYEYPKVKYGWISIVIGMVPGVAAGFALYLFLRSSQLPADNGNETVSERLLK